jgi:hypothetical protein
MYVFVLAVPNSWIFGFFWSLTIAFFVFLH